MFTSQHRALKRLIDRIFLDVFEAGLKMCLLLDRLQVVYQVLEMSHDVRTEVTDSKFGLPDQLQIIASITFCYGCLEWYDFHPDAQNSDREIDREIYQENSRSEFESAEAF